ncbi:MAG TPA: hypothetical protein VFM54_06730 [Micromonosporaceae bacterium]|nr:hypothetical protein [Micromonosporaceae bacterium]
MSGPARIEWRRAFPFRALGVLAWYVILGAAALVAAIVLFGSEPATLSSGRLNPLSLAPAVVGVLVAAIGVPVVLALLRRPIVSADHFALTVRPGYLRTLMLPWAHITEVATYAGRGETFLLVRCGGRRDDRLGDWPHWWDRSVLRSAARASRMSRLQRGRGPAVAGYHLAVRMGEFAGSPQAQLAALCSVAPDHVVVASERRRAAVPEAGRRRPPIAAGLGRL